MIPLKLTVKNFLCYKGDVPTLDLEGVHVACLCGQNGHGKSALLDSMTWALWGRARGKSHDELIYYGEDEMLVDLEFLSKDTRYRVARRHAMGRRRRGGVSDLQLQVSTPSGYQPITGNTIRETQAKIDDITGMDYDTFINTAFLLQGRADEFTTRSPGERKEVLAKVLDLGVYDQLQDRAKTHVEYKKGVASILEDDLERMRREISREDGYVTELDVVNQDLEGVKDRLQSVKESLDALKARVDELRRKQGDLAELERRIPNIEADLLHIQSEMDGSQGRIESYKALLEAKSTIEGGLAHFQDLRNVYEGLNLSRESFDQLNARKSELQGFVDGAGTRLEEQVKQLRTRVADLRSRIDSAPNIASKLEESREQIDALDAEESSIADQRKHLQELSGLLGQHQARSDQLSAEGQELRSKLDLVKSSHQGAQCPLCGTQLGVQECQLLLDNYQDQIREKRQMYSELQRDLKKAEQDKLDLEQALPRRETALNRGRQESQAAFTTLERQSEDSELASVELEAAVANLGQQEHLLEQRAYAADEQQQLVDLGSRIQELGYDQAAHTRLYGEMQSAQHFEQDHRLLQEAEKGLPQSESSLDRAQEMHQHLQQDLTASRTRQAEAGSEVTQLPEWQGKLTTAGGVSQELENRQMQLLRRQGELQGELKKIHALEQEIEHKQHALRAARDEQSIYQELTDALSKRGVQALLIETVLPRVEEEANLLLGRMTDDRMHLKLETQRERKSGKGEPVETLEIKISDELGARSYELFSGGEAFRVNLALRIALSKVLAHRKGAPLPTLFIDEGFGTQDAAGKEKILDVIRAIEDDFQKIIIITHLDELKESFPVRIEVEKQETGSTFWIT